MSGWVVLWQWVVTSFMGLSVVALMISKNESLPPEHRRGARLIHVGKNVAVGGWMLLTARSAYTLYAFGYLADSAVAMVAIPLISLGTVISIFGKLLQNEEERRIK